MSAFTGSRSEPARRLASAAWYHTNGLIAPEKPELTVIVFVLPSTADVALHVSGSNVALTWMGTLLGSRAPQMLAAAWNTFRRCWPIVVPGLPGAGATGVGSLKPSPAASPLMIV